VVQAMMEAEVEALVGPKGRHDPARRAVRHGRDDGLVTLGGRQVAIRRPRVRSADGTAEVPLVTYDCVASTEVLGQIDAYRFPWRTSPRGEGGAMTTQPRERDGQRARKMPVLAERHRRRERARRAPRRPTCRRDRERGRGDRPGGTPARLQGGSEFRVAPEWVERRTSTKLDPGVTSRKTARIRDRERTGSSAGRTRSRCHASAFFAAAESARNVPRLLQSTGGSAEPICRTLW